MSTHEEAKSRAQAAKIRYHAATTEHDREMARRLYSFYLVLALRTKGA